MTQKKQVGQVGACVLVVDLVVSWLVMTQKKQVGQVGACVLVVDLVVVVTSVFKNRCVWMWFEDKSGLVRRGEGRKMEACVCVCVCVGKVLCAL